MRPEKNSHSAWELSNTDTLKQAGMVKANGAALLVIDFQNFNANKKGFLGYLFEDRNNAIQKTIGVVEKARQAAIPVIYLNTILNPDLMPDTTLFAKLNKNIPWDKFTPKEREWNFAVIDELRPKQGDYIIEKGSWSNGFRDTDLRSMVHALKFIRLFLLDWLNLLLSTVLFWEPGMKDWKQSW